MANDFEANTLIESEKVFLKTSNDLEGLNNENTKAKEKLAKSTDNTRMAAEQQAEVEQNKSRKETSETIAMEEKKIKELEASRDTASKKVLSDSELEVSKLQSQIMATEREITNATQSECAKLDAEAKAYAKGKQTDAKRETAARIATGQKAIGEAEGEASAAFAARRSHEAEMRRLDILERLVHKEGMHIATSQENTMGLSQDNAVVTQVAQQGLEALRAKLAEVTATSLSKIKQAKPSHQDMR